ncbi:MAG: class I SAM-dependent methyltransferase [Alphaproteobacteria bacterium]|nr:class I SAM-dependent methyltransferase [Alphaproteobacteria bacterium]MCD8520529.1 class I SAM-dependent methyltransferase [Alphaproteobacteria bacterium]MCD8570629.1 class I SAM-dependent methyltransferase [Alphaproteobacteria bacterium]
MSGSLERITAELEQLKDPNVTGTWVSALVKEIPELGRLPPISNDFWTSDLKKAVCNPFFLHGLKNVIIPNISYEKALTRLRKALLLFQPDIPDFIEAMQAQCFLNEYVFYVSDEEKEALKNTPLRALYESPPYKNHPVLALSDIEDKVSKKVKSQYEENPYPRWATINKTDLEIDHTVRNVLVAGCGTGRQSVYAGFGFPNAKITAIDLSQASLSYAMEKTKEYGLEIAYYQGDLLHAAKLNQKFDLILCSGVLHHMEDPEAGFDALLDVLAEGGRMKLGLYSRLARYDVNYCRAHIKQKGYQSTADDIRAFRMDVMNAAGMLSDLKLRADFYTLSRCRDLVFHVQEHQFSIPEIKEFVGKKAKFLGFQVDPVLWDQYQKEFPHNPDAADLDQWHLFEQKYPHSFRNMYNFILQK